MRLVPLELVIEEGPLPPRAAGFLASAQSRIDRWFARDEHQAGIGFIPSHYEQVWHALSAIRHQHADARRLLEWGSGFGVVAGFSELLGLDAYGIEIDRDLVIAANELLGEHELQATLAHGSFVPASFDGDDFFDLETRTVFGAPDAYNELGFDLDDFDLVFAYPWPTEEELYCEMFRRNADFGAVLLTWSRQEGMRAYRKVAGDSIR
ncbi:MAG: hypothetical protein AB8H80_07175 [Planctomycetota bacterium]